ncbi:ubiquitin family protein [Sporobolomyces salmoneus]|uniref:ubiquitin family protein n=1 Tax=Sporobolomyces salmoneus TaxID=183962 RepID=UPI003171F433
MESLIPESRLAEELAAFKATAGLLATQKIRFSSNYVPPLQDRHRKPTLVNVPVCEPPSTSSEDQDESGASDEQIQLTIKSSKPPLTFTISASPTSTILSLKQQLADSHSSKGAPAAEGQRWILKGKSMGDQKLLKEFSVQDGAVINLMVTKTVPPPSSSSATTTTTNDDPEEATAQAVPSLTLSEPSASESSSSQTTATMKPTISLDNLPPPSHTNASVHSSAAYRDRIQDPDLWEEVRSLLEKRFEGVENKDAESQQAWEAMLAGCQEWIDPGKKALIREKVGYSAMGGY